MSDDKLPRRSWTTREAATQLGLNYNQLMGLVHSGRLRAVKAGKNYLIPDSALSDLLEESESKSA